MIGLDLSGGGPHWLLFSFPPGLDLTVVSELTFLIEEDVDGGYIARALGEPIFTQAETREELLRNIRDAVQCHFASPDQTPRILRLHYVRDEVLTL